jgi:hypothetical protein
MYFTSTRQFFLKHHNRNSYLCTSDTSGGRAYLSECGFNKATDFNYEKKSEGIGLLAPVNDSRALDVDKSNYQVILWPKHGRGNQQFNIMYTEPDRFALVSENRCITRKDNGQHYMESCKYSEDQQFVIVYNVEEKDDRVVPKEYVPSRSFGGLFSSNNGILNKIGQLMGANKALSRYLSESHVDHSHGLNPVLSKDVTDIHKVGVDSPSSLTNPHFISSVNPSVPDSTSPTNIDTLTGVSRTLKEPEDQFMTEDTLPKDPVDRLSKHSDHRVHGDNSGSDNHGSHSKEKRHGLFGSSLLEGDEHPDHIKHGLFGSNFHEDVHVHSHNEDVSPHPHPHHGAHGRHNRHNQHYHKSHHGHDEREEIHSI